MFIVAARIKAIVNPLVPPTAKPNTNNRKVNPANNIVVLIKYNISWTKTIVGEIIRMMYRMITKKKRYW